MKNLHWNRKRGDSARGSCRVCLRCSPGPRPRRSLLGPSPGKQQSIPPTSAGDLGPMIPDSRWPPGILGCSPNCHLACWFQCLLSKRQTTNIVNHVYHALATPIMRAFYFDFSIDSVWSKFFKLNFHKSFRKTKTCSLIYFTMRVYWPLKLDF